MGRLNDFVSMVKEGRIGFLFDEHMIGEHRFEPGFGDTDWRPMEFRATWGPKYLTKWLNPRGGEFLTQELHGSVTIDGLCTNAECHGTLELKYFDEHRIRYTFDFGANGKEYHYVGEKVNIMPWNLPTSHTTCFGTLTEVDTGRLVSKSVTYFKLHTAPGFLLSMRLA
jgi:hypothetical protein